MNRKWLWAGVLVIGLALVIVPLAISMPSRASAGQDMMDGFRPIMQPAHVATTADYYYNVFTPLGKVVPIFAQMPSDMQAAFGQAVQQAGVDPAVFARVPAGLAFYKSLVTTMQAQVDNYEQVDSLPSFDWFTWFFVVPGILLVLLAVAGIWGDAIARHVPHRHGHPTPAH